MRSINRTLGHEPEDPAFIVKLEAQVERWTVSLSDLEITQRVALDVSPEWNNRYQTWWDDEAR